VELSVVIPTFNKVALLEQTLAALEQQIVPRDLEWEVVVVDDGSTDGTAAALERRARRARVRLRPVSPGRNVGRAAARNFGAQQAEGRFLLFLDDDIVAPPDLVAAHLKVLAVRTNRGTIGYAVTEPSLVDGPHFAYLDSRAVAKLPPGRAPAKYFVTQNAAVPRAAFLSVGGFDEQFSAYGFEDMEVAFRLEEQAGLVFHALTQPVPHHVHHHTLAEYLEKKRECGVYSLPLLAAKHPRRLADMGLNLVIDPPGAERPRWSVRLLRRGARRWPGRFVQALVARWPTDARHQPRWRRVYFRCMDLAVFSGYCQGLNESVRVRPSARATDEPTR
jgi:glycosyltransferase involved in cell wall biosynthesis